MEALNGLSDIGDCVARVEYLLKELKSLEEKAKVHTHAHTRTHTSAHTHTPNKHGHYCSLGSGGNANIH